MLDLQLTPEIAEARVAKAPIVALESTLVAHGLPWPDNLEVALELEAVVRERGAVPATIAIVDGQACIGLARSTLEKLARTGKSLPKAGAPDLAVHLARKTSAATTVSATALLAVRAGIQVFSTGGIGGVHRGDSADVSHDLVALARTPIAVISAGAKAILDLHRTIETLETLGVLVVGYRTDELPAFYTPTSGIKLEHSVTSTGELVKILRHHWQELGGGGVLVCNPIPASAALDAKAIDRAISAALTEAHANDISGKQLTPYLLERLAEITNGASIRANRALAVQNAKLGSDLAVSFAKRRPDTERPFS